MIDIRRFCALAVAALVFSMSGCMTAPKNPAPAPQPRSAFWIDYLRGEPIAFDDLLAELQPARAVYLGEYHTMARHHELQLAILNGLAARNTPLVLAMEQFEFMAQPALDRFNQGAIDLAQLIQETELDKRWRGHSNYHALLNAAQKQKIPVLALNARAETVRAVGRQSLSGITPEQRAELPREIVTNDPAYEKHVTRLLGVHMAFDPRKLRPVFEAQVSRDETMAARLAEYLASPAGSNRTAIVICGRGHCEFGLGMPDRVARRMPDTIQRIVLFSTSGDLRLSEAERKQAREIEVQHQFLRNVDRPLADFLHVMEAVGATP